VTVAAAALGIAVLADAPTTSMHTSPTSIAPTSTRDDAIATWVALHRGELFRGSTGQYEGSCATWQPPGSLCSSRTEDLGQAEIHMIGVYATDDGVDLLLTYGVGGWSVTRWAPWPELGTPSYGAPWSPQTTIATWWATHVDAMGLSGAVHISSCDTAAEVVANGIGQPILCSTLVADTGTTRTYRSGLVGNAPEVELVLERHDDSTWTVRSVGAAR